MLVLTHHLGISAAIAGKYAGYQDGGIHCARIGRDLIGHGYKLGVLVKLVHLICDGRWLMGNGRSMEVLCGCNRILKLSVRWNERNTQAMEDITGMIAIVFSLACIFGIAYLFYSTRHRERMAMIERGMEVGLRKPSPDPRKALKDGMQWVAAAVGLGLGYLLDTLIPEQIEEVFIYFGAVAFTVGIANIIYHLMFHTKNLDRASDPM